jgi:hypothetical protein
MPMERERARIRALKAERLTNCVLVVKVKQGSREQPISVYGPFDPRLKT